MEKRTSAAARIAAALALVGAVLIVIVIVSTAMNSHSTSKHHHNSSQPTHKEKKHRTTAKTYTVELGDTLTSIAQETGVSVAEIINLNPDVDPQILRAGETLKLR